LERGEPLTRTGQATTQRQESGDRWANYNPVLSAAILSLTCGDGTVDQAGDARPAEAMGH
jgi:hypothetical protein